MVEDFIFILFWAQERLCLTALKETGRSFNVVLEIKKRSFLHPNMTPSIARIPILSLPKETILRLLHQPLDLLQVQEV
jgi:hypothetical protein